MNILYQYEYMVSLHLTLPAAGTAQMPWEEFSAALGREQEGLVFANVLNRDIVWSTE